MEYSVEIYCLSLLLGVINCTDAIPLWHNTNWVLLKAYFGEYVLIPSLLIGLYTGILYIYLTSFACIPSDASRLILLLYETPSNTTLLALVFTEYSLSISKIGEQIWLGGSSSFVKI